jgi:ribonuclease VapC
VSRIVLDSSALLAIVNNERGAEIFSSQLDLLENATMSAVNVAEAYTKIVKSGMDPENAWNVVTVPISEIANFASDQAKVCGQLVLHTSSLGLSLGDRACLALGIVLDAPIYTADRAWKKLNLGVPIHVIR